MKIVDRTRCETPPRVTQHQCKPGDTLRVCHGGTDIRDYLVLKFWGKYDGIVYDHLPVFDLKNNRVTHLDEPNFKSCPFILFTETEIHILK